MKKLLILLLTFPIILSVQAQKQNSRNSIKQSISPKIAPVNSIDSDDILDVLNTMNIHFFKFDMSQFSAKTYDFTFYIEEFIDGKSVNVEKTAMGANKMDIRWFPDMTEQDKVDFRKENGMSKGENIRTLGEKISIYITPTNENDSTSILTLNVKNKSRYGSALKLKTLDGLDKPMYRATPYSLVTAPALGNKTPLMFYCSFWKDSRGIFRCCMERVLNPDMKSDVYQLSLHYYIIGIIITESKEQLQN